MFWDKDKNYTKRTAKEYNIWRTIFQFIICRIFYMIRLRSSGCFIIFSVLRIVVIPKKENSKSDNNS